MAQRWRLELVTPWGTVTRQKRGNRPFTLDHAWATGGLTVQYYGNLGYVGSDHLAQLISVEAGQPLADRRNAPVGWSWVLMDKGLARAEVANLRFPREIKTAEELDKAVDDLISQLQRIADVSTPRRKPNHERTVP